MFCCVYFVCYVLFGSFVAFGLVLFCLFFCVYGIRVFFKNVGTGMFELSKSLDLKKQGMTGKLGIYLRRAKQN